MRDPNVPHPTSKSVAADAVVRLIDDDNAEGTDRITFACDLSGRYNPSMVAPVVRETKFC